MPRKKAAEPKEAIPHKPELVVITGLSGSGKGSVLKSLEDLGFYSVDNLPVQLIPKFAELTCNNPSIQAAALVVDIREGAGLKVFPEVFKGIRKSVTARLIFLEADDDAIVRRFSETRRPHPLGTDKSIIRSIRSEREQLASTNCAILSGNASADSAINPRFRSTSPASVSATACPRTAIWSLTSGSCRTLTIFRDLRT